MGLSWAAAVGNTQLVSQRKWEKLNCFHQTHMLQTLYTSIQHRNDNFRWFFFCFRISAFIGGTDFLIVMFSVFKTFVSSRLHARRFWLHFRQVQCLIHFKTFWPALQPMQWLLELFAQVKSSWPEGDYSSPCNTEVQNSWNYTSATNVS